MIIALTITFSQHFFPLLKGREKSRKRQAEDISKTTRWSILEVGFVLVNGWRSCSGVVIVSILVYFVLFLWLWCLYLILGFSKESCVSGACCGCFQSSG